MGENICKQEAINFQSTAHWINVVHTNNAMLLGPKKEWNSDMCYSIDVPWRYYTKWNKPDTKGKKKNYCMILRWGT